MLNQCCAQLCEGSTIRVGWILFKRIRRLRFTVGGGGGGGGSTVPSFSGFPVPDPSVCYSEVGGSPLNGCECYDSCTTCGYSDMPVEPNNCITCKDGLILQYEVNGTGQCMSNNGGYGAGEKQGMHSNQPPKPSRKKSSNRMSGRIPSSFVSPGSVGSHECATLHKVLVVFVYRNRGCVFGLHSSCNLTQQCKCISCLAFCVLLLLCRSLSIISHPPKRTQHTMN